MAAAAEAASGSTDKDWSAHAAPFPVGLPYMCFSSAEYHCEDSDSETSEHLPIEEDHELPPVVVEEGAEEHVMGAGGAVWHVHVVPDNYYSDQHCDKATGSLKPRRPLPQIRASDFFGSLKPAEEGAWVYRGQPINGWPALKNLAVVHVTGKVRRRLGLTKTVRRFWDVHSPRLSQAPPSFPASLPYVRVRVQGPDWTLHGWTRDSPGFAFWAARQRQEDDAAAADLRVFHGENMLRAAFDGSFSNQPAEASPTRCRAVRAHMLAHRYAKRNESAKDRITYHAAVFLEWSHGLFGTIVELAWWNGLGGYGGKSNWYHDRDAPLPVLYAAMPDAMKAPWRQNKSELRALDVPMRNKAELEAYLARYTGADLRFLHPTVAASAKVALSHRTQADVMRCLLNYIRRNPEYHEENRNCQVTNAMRRAWECMRVFVLRGIALRAHWPDHFAAICLPSEKNKTFAADFFGFLAGRKGVEPFHQTCRVLYKPRPYLFLYGPTPDGEEDDFSPTA